MGSDSNPFDGGDQPLGGEGGLSGDEGGLFEAGGGLASDSGGFAGGGSTGGSGNTAPVTVNPPVVLQIKPGDLSQYFAGFDISDAVLRVSFDASPDPYNLDPYNGGLQTPYINGYFGVVSSEDKAIKTFVGFFETAAGGVIRLINIPLVGQSLGALVRNLNAFAMVRAEILNDASLLNSSCLEISPPQNATSVWSFFFESSECVPYSTGGSTLRDDMKFYLTSIEPNMSQGNPTQSLGGFKSPTQLYGSSKLSYSASFYDTFLVFDDNSLSQYSLIQMGDEIISIAKWDSNKAIVMKRSDYGTPIRFHPEGTVAKGLNKSDIFDGVLSKDNKQYRCIAIKNTGTTEIAKDVRIYFRLFSRNDFSDTKLAIEIPRSEYQAGTASDGTAFVVVAEDFANKFQDDYFSSATLTFTTGQNASQSRTVKSFQSLTGKITLEEPLPFTPKSGDVFYIDAAPAQILQSGTVSPSVVSRGKDGAPYLISAFSTANTIGNSISINVLNKRSHGGNLHPNDVIYVWIERSIFASNEEFLNSRAVLSISYSRV